MTGFIVLDDGTDRARWLQKRTLGVSATDAARILTGGPAGRASLRKEKETGSSFGGNAYTRHGNDREPFIAAWAAAEFGLAHSTALLAATDEDGEAIGQGVPLGMDLATPDALAPSMFGEFKTTVKDWPTWGDVPAQYRWQVAWQFHVTGADRCVFAFEPHVNFVPVYMEPRHFIVERADMRADIEEAVRQVAAWRTGGTAEVPEGLEALDGLLTQRAYLQDAADALTAQVVALNDEVRQMLTAHGHPVKFEGTDANVSWTGTPVSKSRFDSTAFKAAHPDLHTAFTTTTTEAQPRLSITARS